MKKDGITSCCAISCFSDRELERKAENEQGVDANEASETRKAELLEKRFNVVLLCEIKSHFVTVDSRALDGIMQEISSGLGVSTNEVTGENRETHWRSIIDSKRLKTSKKKVFTGMFESDGVSICRHYRRLKADRPVRPSASSSANHEENKEADPATQEVEENDFMVGAAKHEDGMEAGPSPQDIEDNDLSLAQTPETQRS